MTDSSKDEVVDIIHKCKVAFISLKNESIMAWCTPFGMAINIYGLDPDCNDCQYLTNEVAFFTLYGNELAHFISRFKCDDFNMSTPNSTSLKDPNGCKMNDSKFKETNNRECGLFFELAVIGKKYWITTITGNRLIAYLEKKLKGPATCSTAHIR